MIPLLEIPSQSNAKQDDLTSRSENLAVTPIIHKTESSNEIDEKAQNCHKKRKSKLRRSKSIGKLDRDKRDNYQKNGKNLNLQANLIDPIECSSPNHSLVNDQSGKVMKKLKKSRSKKSVRSPSKGHSCNPFDKKLDKSDSKRRLSMGQNSKLKSRLDNMKYSNTSKSIYSSLFII